jgi:hypothetical protein
MKRPSPAALPAAFVSLSLALAGCHAAMSTHDAPPASSAKPGQTNAINHWPLVFNAHWFGTSCYSTYGCRVEYANFTHRDDPDDQLRRSSASVGPGYPANLRGGWGPVPNFPPPVVVDWCSADGTRLHAEIDIGEIFKDQLVRHNVPREDAGPTYNPQPQIILEVNDRTINVYMRAMIYLKKPRFPDRPLSDYQDDLIKAFSHTY